MLFKEEADALQVAAEMERGAVRVYERALLLTVDDAMAAAIESMLTDEREHLCRFTALLKESLQSGSEVTEPQLTDALAADVLLPGGVMGMVRADGLKDVPSLYRFAAEREREAVEKYTAFAEKSTGAVQEAFLAIADEEKGHLAKLERELEEMA